MRTAIFIDGQSLHKSTSALGFDVDFKRLRAVYFPEDYETVTLEFFHIEATKADGSSTMRKLIDWLDQNGFRTRIIQAAMEQTGSIKDTRSELMTWMALSIAQAARRGADEIIIWSNDRSMIRAAQFAQQDGARVTIVSDLNSTPSQLKRAADLHVNLGTMRADICQEAAA